MHSYFEFRGSQAIFRILTIGNMTLNGARYWKIHGKAKIKRKYGTMELVFESICRRTDGEILTTCVYSSKVGKFWYLVIEI